MKSKNAFGCIVITSIAALVFLLGACNRPTKGTVTTYGELFAQIDSLMASNSYKRIHAWPWSKNVITTSLTNEIPDADYMYYLSGSYEAHDFGFLKVIVRHKTGLADFSAEWASLPHREGEIRDIQQSVRQLVAAYKERAESGDRLPTEGSSSARP